MNYIELSENWNKYEILAFENGGLLHVLFSSWGEGGRNMASSTKNKNRHIIEQIPFRNEQKDRPEPGIEPGTSRNYALGEP